MQTLGENRCPRRLPCDDLRFLYGPSNSLIVVLALGGLGTAIVAKGTVFGDWNPGVGLQKGIGRSEQTEADLFEILFAVAPFLWS
jgi:hypothetical protein